MHYIVSTGRTGTKSLSVALNNVEGVMATHEGFPRGHCTSFRNISNRRWDGTLTDEEAGEKVAKLIYATTPDHNVAIDSNCGIWNCIDLIHSITPDAKFVWVQRDRKDTVLSMFYSGFYKAYDTNKEEHWDSWAHRGFIDIRGKYSDKDREFNCNWTYAIRHHMIGKHLSALDTKNVIIVQFDEMINSKKVLSQMLSHFGVEGVTKVHLPHLNNSR